MSQFQVFSWISPNSFDFFVKTVGGFTLKSNEEIKLKLIERSTEALEDKETKRQESLKF